MKKLINDFHRQLLDEIYDGVYFVDLDRNITYWNRAAEKISGYKSDEVIGRSCRDNILIHVDCKGLELCGEGCPLGLAISDGKSSEVETYLHHKKGYRIPVAVRAAPVTSDKGNTVGAVEIFSDISQIEVIKHRMKELERLALLDHLTGLPNRRYAEEELSVRLAEHTRYSWPVGVMMIDIDHFKLVNDKYGHDLGDEVLRTAGQTLLRNSRPFDLVGRWGGEEFISIVRNVDKEPLKIIAERYRALVEKSKITMDEDEVSVTISLGGTLIVDGDTTESIIKRADDLLYASKNSGRNRVTLE